MSKDTVFLGTVRKALGLPENNTRSREMFPDLFARKETSDLLQSIQSRTTEDEQSLIHLLEENCLELNITSHQVNTLQEATCVVVELVRSKDPEFSFNKHIMLHDHPDLAGLELWKRFNREAVTVHTSFASDKDVLEKTKASFIGITAPPIAVAESATLIQITTPGCPRSTSLVPSIHVALLRRENIVGTLEEGYAVLHDQKPQDSFVFISGPSKTADIEAHMVHGAHGPRELHIIILDEPVELPQENLMEDGAAVDESSSVE
jgi:L-lactate dehydrogenase complex protein LldG